MLWKFIIDFRNTLLCETILPFVLLRPLLEKVDKNAQNKTRRDDKAISSGIMDSLYCLNKTSLFIRVFDNPKRLHPLSFFLYR